MNKKQGDPVVFSKEKEYKFINYIGQGGTGQTVLLRDETIDEIFVGKKYSPLQEELKEIHYGNFKTEIKILHQIHHENIVRIFNYHLYPEDMTGFIIMEHIKGQNIQEYIREHPENINEIFKQVVAGFTYLEKIKVLHRDLRPDNILITSDGVVKIIDFGFSKLAEFEKDGNKSISLNWRYDTPQDFNNGTYDHKTEVYFVGKMFEELIKSNKLGNFAYNDILKSMISKDRSDRINSFNDVDVSLSESEFTGFEFSEEEKANYQTFAIPLESLFSKIQDDAEYVREPEIIIRSLDSLYRDSLLEEYVQDISSLTKCFVKGMYRYFPKQKFEVEKVKDFSSFLKSLSTEKQKVVINHIFIRIDKIEKYNALLEFDPDDIPF